MVIHPSDLTEAAIIATMAESFQPIPSMRISRIGYGAGQRTHQDRPNLLRIILGTGLEEKGCIRDGVVEDQILVIETNIDDMNPELFGYLMERLFDDGALDVYWIPIYMKKTDPVPCFRFYAKRIVGIACWIGFYLKQHR